MHPNLHDEPDLSRQVSAHSDEAPKSVISFLRSFFFLFPPLFLHLLPSSARFGSVSALVCVFGVRVSFVFTGTVVSAFANVFR